MNKICFILISAALYISNFATPAYPASADSDMKGLIIDGRNFWFMISEPDGWSVEINDANARKLNAYFVPHGYTFNNAPGVMYIRVLDKQGLTVEQHLAADGDDFKKRHSVQFKKFNMHGIRYRYATRLDLIDNQYCDYLCYVDPGATYQSYLIFVLSADMKVCNKYTDLYRTFLKSFFWGGDDVRVQ
jgi:hypothetical protein